MINKDDIVYIGKLHWVLFLAPIMLIGISIYCYFNVYSLDTVSLFFIVIGLVWLLVIWGTYHFSSLIIKKKQIILRTGILVRQTVDIPFSKIESIDIRQSILGSLLNYGSLMITGTGGSRQAIQFLRKPLTCRRYIEQLMYE